MAKFTSRQISVIVTCLCAVFMLMGILTIVAILDSNDPNYRNGGIEEEVDDGDTVVHRKQVGDPGFKILGEGVDDEAPGTMRIGLFANTKPTTTKSTQK